MSAPARQIAKRAAHGKVCRSLEPMRTLFLGPPKAAGPKRCMMVFWPAALTCRTSIFATGENLSIKRVERPMGATPKRKTAAHSGSCFLEHCNRIDASSQFCTQNQIEAQRSGFDLERRSKRAGG